MLRNTSLGEVRLDVGALCADSCDSSGEVVLACRERVKGVGAGPLRLWDCQALVRAKPRHTPRVLEVMIMSKVMSLPRLVVLCALAAVLVSAVSAASAAAEDPFASPALKVCKKVPSGWLGLFSESHCATNVRSGSWTWTTPDGQNNTWYCLLWTNGTPRYATDLCQEESATGQFEAKLLAGEPFPKLLGTGGLSILTGKDLGVKTEIDCTANSFAGQPETGKLTGAVAIKYTGCTSVKPTGCEVKSTGEPAGTIATAKLMGTLASTRLVTFKPEGTTKFVEIEYSGSCALKNNTIPVEGSQMCTYAANIETPEDVHELVCKASESELKFGEGATYEGKVNIMVEGGNLWKNF